MWLTFADDENLHLKCNKRTLFRILTKQNLSNRHLKVVYFFNVFLTSYSGTKNEQKINENVDLRLKVYVESLAADRATYDRGEKNQINTLLMVSWFTWYHVRWFFYKLQLTTWGLLLRHLSLSPALLNHTLDEALTQVDYSWAAG